MTLKEFRKKKGLTLMQTALLFKVSVNTIISWERGVSMPSKENQELIDRTLEKEI